MDNVRGKLVVTGKYKTNSFGQEKFSLAKSEEGCSYIFLLDLYKDIVLKSQ